MRLLRLAVAAHRHEVDLEREVDVPDEVGEEHRAAAEDRDEHGLPPLVVPGDGAAELLHPAADVLAPEQDARDLRHRGEPSRRHRGLSDAAMDRRDQRMNPETACRRRGRRWPAARIHHGAASPSAGIGDRSGAQRHRCPTVRPGIVTRRVPTRSPGAGGNAAARVGACDRARVGRSTSAGTRPAIVPPATTGTVPPRMASSPHRVARSHEGVRARTPRTRSSAARRRRRRHRRARRARSRPGAARARSAVAIEAVARPRPSTRSWFRWRPGTATAARCGSGSCARCRSAPADRADPRRDDRARTPASRRRRA